MPFIAFASKDCEDKLNRSYWILPPHGQQLAVGLLAEDSQGRRVLGVLDYYWGSHERLHKYLGEHYGPDRILWSGELLIENDQPRYAQGKIVLSINTSGYAWEKTHDLGTVHRNDPRLLMESLNLYRPDLRADQTQYFTFDIEHGHLDLFFQELQRRIGYNEQDTVRHRFRNILNVIHLMYNYLLRKPPVTWQEGLRLLDRISAETMSDVFYYLESRLQFSQGQSGEPTIKDLESLNELRDEAELATPAGLERFTDLLSRAISGPDLTQETPEVIVLNPAGPVPTGTALQTTP